MVDHLPGPERIAKRPLQRALPGDRPFLGHPSHVKRNHIHPPTRRLRPRLLGTRRMAEEVALVPPSTDQPVRHPTQSPGEVRLDAKEVEGVLGHAVYQDEANAPGHAPTVFADERRKKRTQFRARPDPSRRRDERADVATILNSIVSRVDSYHSFARNSRLKRRPRRKSIRIEDSGSGRPRRPILPGETRSHPS
jgi:hypothetical protein